MFATRSPRIVRVLAAASAVVALPAFAAAQSVAKLDTVAIVVPPFSRADTLDLRAESLLGSPKTWRQAAYEYQLSASLRTLEEVRGIESLVMAAHLFYALGDLRSAQSAMEHAGD